MSESCMWPMRSLASGNGNGNQPLTQLCGWRSQVRSYVGILLPAVPALAAAFCAVTNAVCNLVSILQRLPSSPLPVKCVQA